MSRQNDITMASAAALNTKSFDRRPYRALCLLYEQHGHTMTDPERQYLVGVCAKSSNGKSLSDAELALVSKLRAQLARRYAGEIE